MNTLTTIISILGVIGFIGWCIGFLIYVLRG